MNTGKFNSVNPINPIIQAINTLFNYAMLNLVCLITCLPVITIGTALSSLYYVVLKEADGEAGYLVRPYLRELKHNMKNGTAAFLIFSGTGAALLFNLLFWPAQGNPFSAVITGVLAILTVIWRTVSHYTYPLIGRFVNTPLQSIKNAWGLALVNWKQTLLLLVIDIVLAGFYLFFPLKIVLLAVPLAGFVLPACWRAKVLLRVFAPYEATQNGQP
ncbi:MAG: YesL family protein [Eubacterium sp.]|nr:YesL family protein [Eubacterium sp.]